MSQIVSQEYKNWIESLKVRFQSSQIKASIQVNSTLLEFYWNLGSEIIQKQKEHKWGSGFLNQLSIDLSKEFPEVKGFSVTNISYISRNVLLHQIETNLYKREAKAITNFEATLPPLQSDLAKEITKDPYNFDFLAMTSHYKEKELEDALCENITKFLLELGVGFAFVGRQYKLQVGNEEFRIDRK